MTLGGWIMLIGSWLAITVTVVVTVWKTLTAKPGSLTSTLELELEDKGPGSRIS